MIEVEINEEYFDIEYQVKKDDSYLQSIAQEDHYQQCLMKTENVQ